MYNTERDFKGRNAALGYGLTLVAGLPLPPAITAGALAVQAQVEDRLPDRFVWYGASHLHITLAALLRTRYRAAPPLTLAEIPSDLGGFIDALAETFSKLQPFTLTLGRTHLDEEGVLLIDMRGGNNVREALHHLLQRYTELDPPKHKAGSLHMSLGFLCDPNIVKRIDIKRNDVVLPVFSVQTFRVSRVWLVHYANRTLNRILGRVAFELGMPNHLTAETFLQALRIAP